MTLPGGTYFITSVKWGNYVTLNGPTSEPGVPITGANDELAEPAPQKWELKVDNNKYTISLATNAKAFASPAEAVGGAKIIVRSTKQEYELVEDTDNKYRIKVAGQTLYWDLPADEDLTQIQLKDNKHMTDAEWRFTPTN